MALVWVHPQLLSLQIQKQEEEGPLEHSEPCLKVPLVLKSLMKKNEEYLQLCIEEQEALLQKL